MIEPPSYAMRVSDVASSSTFLVEQLGFTLTEHKPEEDIAYMLDTDGDAILLAGPGVQDIASYLSAQHHIAEPGQVLSAIGGDLDARQADLVRRGMTDFQIKQNRVGDRTLIIPIFDHYVFHYISLATHDFADLLDMYAHLSGELDEALAGLSEADTLLALNEENWSIRQIVHHIADSDMLFAQVMKVQLSSSGAVMEWPRPVGNENVTAGPEYRERPIASSVTLSRSFHEYILDVVSYVPDAGKRYISERNGRKHTFSQMLHLIVNHTREHLDEIWSIRRKYGK